VGLWDVTCEKYPWNAEPCNGVRSTPKKLCCCQKRACKLIHTQHIIQHCQRKIKTGKTSSLFAFANLQMNVHNKALMKAFDNKNVIKNLQ